MRNLRKWVVYLMTIINILMLATIGNNDFIIDLLLMLLFAFNCSCLLRYDHKYINKEDYYEE